MLLLRSEFPPFFFPHLSDRNRRRRGSALTSSTLFLSSGFAFHSTIFFASALIMFILTFSLRI